MQTSISKYFGSKSVKASTSSIPSTAAQEVVNLCDDPDVCLQVPTNSKNSDMDMDFKLDDSKHSQFVATIRKNFDQVPEKSDDKFNADKSKAKYTPLEQ